MFEQRWHWQCVFPSCFIYIAKVINFLSEIKWPGSIISFQPFYKEKSDLNSALENKHSVSAKPLVFFNLFVISGWVVGDWLLCGSEKEIDFVRLLEEIWKKKKNCFKNSHFTMMWRKKKNNNNNNYAAAIWAHFFF